MENEPLPMATSIPFLESAWRLTRWKSGYLLFLKEKYRLPIYTLRGPFTRIYVINRSALINAAQRNTNAISFGPVARDFAWLFSGLSKDSQRNLRASHMFKENGDYNRDVGYPAIIHRNLQHGDTLADLSKDAVISLSPRTADWTGNVKLFSQIQHDLGLALTDAIYGPQNPFCDPAVWNSWQDFLPGITKLVMGVVPSVTAYKELRARDRVTAAFEKYFRNHGQLQASSMVESLAELNQSFALPSSEAAKMEISTSLALLSSGAITTFWLMFHVFSDASLLKDIRHELLTSIVTEGEISSDRLVRVVNLAEIKKKCPILTATLREVFRYHSQAISTKAVMEDVVLANQYLLRKGSIVMIPGAVLHKEVSTWGPSAHQFDHTRFLVIDDKKQARTTPTSMFRPFGAGASKCPGRHLATNVILAFMAMIVLQYDISPIGDKEWKMPSKKKADFWNAMPKPDNDVDVFITKGSATQDVKYNFVWGNLKNREGNAT